MRRLHIVSFAASLPLLCPGAFAAVRTHHHGSSHAIVRRSTSAHTTHVGHLAEHASYSGISSERATEIQSALIQRGYLSGEPSGSWDSSSVSAMQKMQSDNGWQTKFVPDSRALIKLGLGAGSQTPVNPSSTASAQTNSAAASAPSTFPGQTF